MKPARIEIIAAGATHVVAIEPADAPGRYRITLGDGEAVVLDAAGVADDGTTTWSLRDIASGTVTTVAVTLGSSGDGEAVTGGHAIPIAVITPRRRGKRMLAGGADGEQRVLAPMPGKVVKVLVKAGDAVIARQGLVVIEAMKMENELTALRPGTVTEVGVVEGASVDAGRLLVVVA